MVTEEIVETALGISSPWFIAGMHSDPSQRTLNIRVDFEVGSRFAVPGQKGVHPVHGTVTKIYRHLNVFRHESVTLFADADSDPARRRVIFVAEGKDAATVEANLRAHHGKSSEIEAVSIDRSPAFTSGVREHLPSAQITFDKFHVIAHASEAIDQMRRIEQNLDPSLRGKRWVLLKDRAALPATQRSELDRLLAKMTATRTARAWQYREDLREILTRQQPHVARLLLKRGCSYMLRRKSEPMKEVAAMIRAHLDGILAWVTSRQTHGFPEAIHGLFQAAKHKARGYGRFRTLRRVIFMIAGKLDFSRINPYVPA